MPMPPLVIMGVSGSGKSTVAEHLAARIDGGEYIDGDDLHPESNVAKMSAGVPLDDVDRAPWLTAVGRAMAASHAEGRTPVMACSALKRMYRQRILAEEPEAFFVLLDVARDELVRRMHSRRGHFMPESLLESQLATLEPLLGSEPGVTVPVQGPAPDVVERVVALVVAAR
ncbi:gluconokinase [Amnibacterium endophyticum]|uniref:Gluconokinase n=1 Tax=Amnibacterium endophyticum TaxID=2109337 RepID=A0ABW4L904_9MICO